MIDTDDRPTLTLRMKALSDAERHAAVDAAPNVIGFGRFVERERQVARSQAFRRPQGGGVA